MDSLYLLVSEGPTDILIIDEIAKKISSEIGKSITIRELSPQRDATTNRYPSHGWEEVRQWCRLYGNILNDSEDSFEALSAKRKNWRAEVELSRADGLIIQIDTDIVEYIDDINPSYSGSTKTARKKFSKKAILNWLGEDTNPDNIFILNSTYSSETWILATHNKTENIFDDLQNSFDFEDIINPTERLINLGYRNYTDSITGNLKLSKDLKIYKNYAKRIADNLVTVRTECEEAENLCKRLGSE